MGWFQSFAHHQQCAPWTPWSWHLWSSGHSLGRDSQRVCASYTTSIQHPSYSGTKCLCQPTRGHMLNHTPKGDELGGRAFGRQWVLGWSTPEGDFVCRSVAKSCPIGTPWTAASQVPLSFIIFRTLRKCISTECWYYLTISSSVTPSPFAFNLSQHQGLFQWVGCSHQGAKGLERQQQSFQWIFRVNFFWVWLVWSPCSPRVSQESSSTPQFESTNSLALSLPYGPAVTFVHDYWKDHSFDYTDLCRQSCPCFLIR